MSELISESDRCSFMCTAFLFSFIEQNCIRDGMASTFSHDESFIPTFQSVRKREVLSD